MNVVTSQTAQVGHALAYLGPKDKKIAAKLVEFWPSVTGEGGSDAGFVADLGVTIFN